MNNSFGTDDDLVTDSVTTERLLVPNKTKFKSQNSSFGSQKNKAKKVKTQKSALEVIDDKHLSFLSPST